MSHNSPDQVAIRSVPSSSLQSVLSDAVRPFSYQQSSSFVAPDFARKGITSKTNRGAIPPAFHYLDGADSFNIYGEPYETEAPYLNTNSEEDTSLNGGASSCSPDLFVKRDFASSVQFENIDGDRGVEEVPYSEPVFKATSQKKITQPLIKTEAVAEGLSDTEPSQGGVPDSKVIEGKRELLTGNSSEVLKESEVIKTSSGDLNSEAASLKSLPKEKHMTEKKVTHSHSVHDLLKWIEKDPAWKQNSNKEQPDLPISNPVSIPSSAELLQKTPTQKERKSSPGFVVEPLRPDSSKASLFYRSDSIQPTISGSGREMPQKREVSFVTDRQRTSDSVQNGSTEKGGEPKIREKIIREVVRVRTVSSNSNQPTRGFAQRSYLTRLLRFRGR